MSYAADAVNLRSTSTFLLRAESSSAVKVYSPALSDVAFTSTSPLELVTADSLLRATRELSTSKLTCSPLIGTPHLSTSLKVTLWALIPSAGTVLFSRSSNLSTYPSVSSRNSTVTESSFVRSS